MKKFKIWAHIEAIDEDVGAYIDLVDEGLVEPISLGEYSDLATAWAHLMELPGYQPHPDDINVVLCAPSIEKDVWTCPSSDQSPQGDEPHETTNSSNEG